MGLLSRLMGSAPAKKAKFGGLKDSIKALGDSETRARPAPVELVVKPRAAHKEGKTHRICGKWPVHQRKEAAFLRRSTVVGAMGRR